MRYVDLVGLEPVPSKAKDEKGELVDAPFHYRDFVMYLVDNEKRFVADGPGIRSGGRVEEQLKKADRFHALEDADWVRLKESAEHPSVDYPLKPPRRLARFLERIQGATEKQPSTPRPPKPTKGATK